jgi:DUF971 family protein
MSVIQSAAAVGLQRHTPRPREITVHTASRVLGIVFDNDQTFRLPFELLRVCSPSAQVKGHGPGQEVLQTGKRHVTVVSVEPVGHYALQLHFSDGHDTGLYSWAYLYDLGLHQEIHWRDYLARLTQAGVDRDTPMADSAGGACGSAAHANHGDTMAVERCGARTQKEKP